jgi:hypothetical protein
MGYYGRNFQQRRVDLANSQAQQGALCPDCGQPWSLCECLAGLEADYVKGDLRDDEPSQ